MKGTIYVWAAGNGGGYQDSCAADGFVNSIYTIAVGSADQNGQQAYYDEDCPAKMAVTFSYNSNTSATASNQQQPSNQLVSLRMISFNSVYSYFTATHTHMHYIQWNLL